MSRRGDIIADTIAGGGMKKFQPEKRIVLIEVLGFFLVIVAIWVDELFHLPHYLFGEPLVPFLMREAIWESTFVGILGLAELVFVAGEQLSSAREKWAS